jgi:hypothetical protein
MRPPPHHINHPHCGERQCAYAKVVFPLRLRLGTAMSGSSSNGMAAGQSASDGVKRSSLLYSTSSALQ